MSRFLLAVATLALVGCQDAAAPDGGNCGNPLALTVGTPISGELSAADCTSDGVREDAYRFQLTAQSILSLSAGSVQFDLMNGSAPAAGQEIFASATGAMMAALPPGSYSIMVHGTRNASYTLSVTPTALPSACTPATPIFIVRGASLNGAITQSSCSSNSYYAQPFQFRGVANQSYTFSSTATVGINLEVNRAGTYLANRSNNNAGSNSLTFRSPATDIYNIGVIAIPQNRFGTYTFSVQ